MHKFLVHHLLVFTLTANCSATAKWRESATKADLIDPLKRCRVSKHGIGLIIALACRVR